MQLNVIKQVTFVNLLSSFKSFENISNLGKQSCNTIKTLSVVDRNGRFRFVHTGTHGGVNDRDQFTSSCLYTSQADYFTDEQFVVDPIGYHKLLIGEVVSLRSIQTTTCELISIIGSAVSSSVNKTNASVSIYNRECLNSVTALLA